MSLIFRSAPVIEPVTLAQAKAHLRLDGTADDPLVNSLILTSRLHIEAAMGLALVAQGWTYTLDRWPARGQVRLPLRPILSIDSIRILASDGSASVVDPQSYLLDGAGLPPRILSVGGSWPQPGHAAQGIEIDLTAGYGTSAADVPAPLMHAILLLVAHWYEHRDVIEIGSAATAIPAPVADLIAPFKVAQL